MDRDRFDNFTRAFANGVTRRRAVGALVAGVFGVAPAVATMQDSGAHGSDDHKRKPDCCPSTRPTLCGYTCVDTEDDPDNAGKKRFTFTAVEGFVPPSSVELATTATENPTPPVSEGELPPPELI